VHQAGVIASLAHDGLNAIFLAEGVEATNELNSETVIGGEALGVGSNLLAERLGELPGVVENADALAMQVEGHPLSMTPTGNGPGNHDTVKTRKRTHQFAGIAPEQRSHRNTPAQEAIARKIQGRSRKYLPLVPAMPG
jgi:hypothetical protein